MIPSINDQQHNQISRLNIIPKYRFTLIDSILTLF